LLNQSYGKGERQRYDLFTPEGGLDAAKGMLAIVHGDYWMALSKDDFSHLAAGPLAHGWAVAMIGYTLGPQARISQITAEVANATNAVAHLGNGPLHLAGHSAGGHLVARMMCRDLMLSAKAVARLDRVVSVSGLHDLRSLRLLAGDHLFQSSTTLPKLAAACAMRPARRIWRLKADCHRVAASRERPRDGRPFPRIPQSQNFSRSGWCQEDNDATMIRNIIAAL
jgi:alpha-beta hydrolase superfamily lysophospholipase